MSQLAPGPARLGHNAGMRLMLAALAALLCLLPAAPASAANPPRPSFREPKADFRDKEFSLTYAFGPASADFALFNVLSLGVAVDQVFNAQSWQYRATVPLIANSDLGLVVALNGAALNVREPLAGNQYAAPTWGAQGGVLATFLSDSGLTLRAGIQYYDTDLWTAGGGGWLFTPEVAYRYGFAELTLAPSFPFDITSWSWVGLRLRI